MALSCHGFSKVPLESVNLFMLSLGYGVPMEIPWRWWFVCPSGFVAGCAKVDAGGVAGVEASMPFENGIYIS